VHFRRRLLLLYLCFAVGLLVIWMRATQLQWIDGDVWAQEARRQRQHPERLDPLRFRHPQGQHARGGNPARLRRHENVWPVGPGPQAVAPLVVGARGRDGLDGQDVLEARPVAVHRE
jgi:hypothetical protein